jgi:hypothetical protein
MKYDLSLISGPALLKLNKAFLIAPDFLRAQTKLRSYLFLSGCTAKPKIPSISSKPFA